MQILWQIVKSSDKLDELWLDPLNNHSRFCTLHKNKNHCHQYWVLKSCEVNYENVLNAWKNNVLLSLDSKWKLKNRKPEININDAKNNNDQHF